MNLSIRFPNISAYFEGMNKSFTVFGFEITVYGILVAVGMLLGACSYNASGQKSIKKTRISIWEWYLSH